MKKYLISLVFALAFIRGSAQGGTPISHLPAYIGNPAGGVVPVSIGNSTRGVDPAMFGYTHCDSLAVSYGNLLDTFRFYNKVTKTSFTFLYSKPAGGGVDTVVRTVTGNTSVAKTDRAILCNTGSGNDTVTVSASLTKRISIKKVSADFNTVVIMPAFGTLDGIASFTLTGTNQSVTIVTDGTNFYIL